LFKVDAGEKVRAVIESALGVDTTFTEEDSVLLIKGAPDILLPYCSSTLCPDGTTVPLDGDLRQRISRLQEAWSGHGQRVILLARKVINAHTDEIPAGMGFEHALFGTTIMKVAESGLTFVGMIGIVVCTNFDVTDSGSSKGRNSGSRPHLSHCRHSLLHGHRVRKFSS
jgi:sodium/potassium-transporting ATPase subunit alpha